MRVSDSSYCSAEYLEPSDSSRAARTPDHPSRFRGGCKEVKTYALPISPARPVSLNRQASMDSINQLALLVEERIGTLELSDKTQMGNQRAVAPFVQVYCRGLQIELSG